MCGRFTLYHSQDEIVARFDLNGHAPLEPRYNIAPTQAIPVIVEHRKKPDDPPARFLTDYRWGLVPSWAKDISSSGRMINARAETLLEKPMFRTALARRRCLIPADGFYEWMEADNPEEGGKTPMHIRRRDGGLFAFAGLWDEWTAPDGSPLRSCTIVTVTPNPLLMPIHDRMPVILPREDEALWLDTGISDTSSLASLLVPYPADEMEAYAVSRMVNRPTTDDPELIRPVAA